ncbi:MAG: TonB-dependent receptor domain-containing protein [Bryobacteraceae bacterium]
MCRKCAKFVVLTLAFCLSVSGPVGAQVLYGTIVGNVNDPSGAVVAGADVTATHLETGRVRSTKTNQAGTFTLNDVLPGTYTLEIGAAGFQKSVHTGVQVAINTVTRADSELRTGVVVETVTVQANAAVLQSDKADVHTELPAKALTELPLPGYRNYQSLIDLVPGATPGVLLNSINDTPMRDLATNVNGTNYNNNDTRIDGALNRMNVISSHVLYVPPAESIETVNVVTANFEAEQGMAGGVSVTVVTKSGTNQFHGSAFAFHTDNALYAKNFFFTDPKAPKNIVNIDGFTFGGPIKRNRLFFFGDWEGTRERKNSLRLTTVATPDQRAGDFSAYNTVIYDPSTGNRDGSGRMPFRDAKIPLDRISAIALKMQSFVPGANRPGSTANFFNSDSQVLDRDNFDMKTDWSRTDKHTIWLKYGRMNAHVLCNPSLGEAGGAGLCVGQKSGTADTVMQLATLGHTWVLTPAILVDGTLGYFRSVQNIRGPLYGVNFGLDVLGIPGTNGSDIRYSGQPIFDITGYGSLGDAGLGNTNPAFRTDEGYSHTSNLSWTKGSHTFRFGFETVRYHQNDWQANTTGGVKGQFSFTGGLTALKGGKAPNQYNAYADFLLGLPQSVSKDLQFYIPQTAREWRFGWYAQDRWQATKDLTLTMGLRYEYYPVFTRADQGIERLDPNTNKVYIGGRGNNPDNAGIEAGKRLFAPRFGLAYRLGGKTVVRGGFGMTIDPSSLWSSLQRLYPASFGSRFSGLSSFEAYRPLEQGIPLFGGPDISSGVIDLPPDAATATVEPGLFRRGYIG